MNDDRTRSMLHLARTRWPPSSMNELRRRGGVASEEKDWWYEGGGACAWPVPKKAEAWPPGGACCFCWSGETMVGSGACPSWPGLIEI